MNQNRDLGGHADDDRTLGAELGATIGRRSESLDRIPPVADVIERAAAATSARRLRYTLVGVAAAAALIAGAVVWNTSGGDGADGNILVATEPERTEDPVAASDAAAAEPLAGDVAGAQSTSDSAARGTASSGEAETGSAAPAGFTALSVSSTHTCGLRADGSVLCWGDNSHGQTDAPDGHFTAIASGWQHSCGVRTDGTLRCWGDHNAIPNGSGPLTAVAINGENSCVLFAHGGIICWNADVERSLQPVPTGPFTAVAVGGTHSCALGVDGDIACWSRARRLDHGDYVDLPLDGQDLAPSGRFTAVAAGSAHSCGLRTDRTVTCWGSNDEGQAAPPSGEFTTIAASGDNSCGLRADATIACWGYVAKIGRPTGHFVALSIGRGHACGLRTDGTVACWGAISDGQTDAPDREFTAVSVAEDRSCGLRADGTIACWGSDERWPKQPDPPPPPEPDPWSETTGHCGYVVDYGDTPYAIAKSFNVRLEDLIEVNDLENPEIVLPGDCLIIPAPRELACRKGWHGENMLYTVESGDTLFSIANEFDVSLDDLVEVNNLVDPEEVWIGITLCIPE